MYLKLLSFIGSIHSMLTLKDVVVIIIWLLLLTAVAILIVTHVFIYARNLSVLVTPMIAVHLEDFLLYTMTPSLILTILLLHLE